ncbi:MAG: Gfo/Idh/MocA family protein [Planctomycetota bacterium]
MTKHTSRREFLAAFPGAFAAPYLLTSQAMGAGTGPPASERVHIGHIGLEWMGGIHLSYYKDLAGVRSVAACDVDSRYLEAGARKMESYSGGKCKRYKDFRRLLDDPDVDAVLIAVPDHWHALISIHAAQAGKDIYCEKPLSLTIREARAMVEAVRRYGRVFQTGSQQRASGNFRHACELVRSGYIGTVRHVTVSVGGPSGPCYLPPQPTPSYIDWDMWLGPAPQRAFSDRIHSRRWRAYRDYSGGGMTDWGAHHFDIAQWGLGMDASGPVAVHPPDGTQHKHLTYQYANGVTMIRGDCNGVLFEGTEGKVEVNRGHLRTKPPQLRSLALGPNDVHLRRAPTGSWRGNTLDWLGCIRTRERSLCDVEIGCRSVTVCHLGNLALWLGRSIRWDPAAERIVGDDEASRWLDRPKRAPWHL